MTPEVMAFWILIINSLVIRKGTCNAGNGNELVKPLTGLAVQEQYTSGFLISSSYSAHNTSCISQV